MRKYPPSFYRMRRKSEVAILSSGLLSVIGFYFEFVPFMIAALVVLVLWVFWIRHDWRVFKREYREMRQARRRQIGGEATEI